MRRTEPLLVYEHTALNIDNVYFRREHWNALGWYNEVHGGGFFTLTPNGVRFHQYVGAIQVGDLTIEILPKVSKSAPEKEKKDWQQILIDMLRECAWMQVYTHEKASLRLKHNSILHAYLELFLNECEGLLRQGLIKKYRHHEGNCKALKGKLLFAQNISKNLVHQERFYTRHQVFDTNNIYNQILLKALKIVPFISNSPLLNDRVYSLLLSFPELEDLSVSESTFQKIIYDRKTNNYKEAIEIAAMLILNYRPDISNGHNHVLAILFDMNELWEEYIYRQSARFRPTSWSIEPQQYKRFWQSGGNYKGIKPDIVIRSDTKCIVLDTKWKIPDKGIPDDADLKQMFIYNEYWNSIYALLVYPDSYITSNPVASEGKFLELDNRYRNVGDIYSPIVPHLCGRLKISVIRKRTDAEGVTLNRNLGSELINCIKSDVFKEN